MHLPVHGLHRQSSCASIFVCNPQRAVAYNCKKLHGMARQCACTGSMPFPLSEEASGDHAAVCFWPLPVIHLTNRAIVHGVLSEVCLPSRPS